MRLPETAERVALSLSDDAQRGPFVGGTRSGHVATCLARDMNPGQLPIVPQERLTTSAVKVDRTRQRAALEDRTRRGDKRLRDLLDRPLYSADSISREDFLEVATWEPLLGQVFLNTYLAMGAALSEQSLVLRQKRLARHTSDAMLHDRWNLLRATGHMALLGSMAADRTQYDELTADERLALARRFVHGVVSAWNALLELDQAKDLSMPASEASLLSESAALRCPLHPQDYSIAACERCGAQLCARCAQDSGSEKDCGSCARRTAQRFPAVVFSVLLAPRPWFSALPDQGWWHAITFILICAIPQALSEATSGGDSPTLNIVVSSAAGMLGAVAETAYVAGGVYLLGRVTKRVDYPLVFRCLAYTHAPMLLAWSPALELWALRWSLALIVCSLHWTLRRSWLFALGGLALARVPQMLISLLL